MDKTTRLCEGARPLRSGRKTDGHMMGRCNRVKGPWNMPRIYKRTLDCIQHPL